MKTLFEKIYFTCAIVNVILFAVAVLIAATELHRVVPIILAAPFTFQGVFTLLYLLIVEVILNRIWGFKIDLFPSLRKNESEQ